MARCTGRKLDFVCLSCETVQSKFCWLYHRAEDQHKNTPFPSVCSNPDCTDSHVTFKPRNRTLAQVRESQRAVVYVTPDGDYMAPWTNDPDDDMAKTAREAGGVRVEFNSIHELRDFQRRHAQSKLDQYERMIDNGEFDEATVPDFKQLRDAVYEQARNQVLEYDEQSLREGQDRIRERIQLQREARERFHEKFRSLRVGRAEDGRRYERLKRGGR